MDKPVPCESDDSDSEMPTKPKVIMPSDDEEEVTDSEPLMPRPKKYGNRLESDDDDDDDDEDTQREVLKPEESDSDDTIDCKNVQPLKMAVKDPGDATDDDSEHSQPPDKKTKSKLSLSEDDDDEEETVANIDEEELVVNIDGKETVANIDEEGMVANIDGKETMVNIDEEVTVANIDGKDTVANVDKEGTVVNINGKETVANIDAVPGNGSNHDPNDDLDKLELCDVDKNNDHNVLNHSPSQPETIKSANNDEIHNDTIAHVAPNDDDNSETDSVSQSSLAELLEQQIQSWYQEDGLKRPKKQPRRIYDDILQQGIDISDLVLNDEENDKLDFEIAIIKNLTLDDLLCKINCYD